jgi:acetoin utilization deacetylase AcuC-like enzyme
VWRLPAVSVVDEYDRKFAIAVRQKRQRPLSKTDQLVKLGTIIAAVEPAVTTAYISHAACLHHDTGKHHPESPQRLYAIEDRLIAAGLMDLLERHEAPRARPEQLSRVHAPAYLEEIQQRAPRTGLVALDADTVMGPDSLEAAYRAAGAVVLGVDLALDGSVETAFCSVRPPGHHAEPNRAMGFCIFNNIAVGAAHALAAGLTRVAIVDFDVHHGNGTEQVFQNDERVMLCSSFQHPFYPNTPLKSGHGRLIHVPLKAGAHSERFQRAIEKTWLPALDRFEPQLILVSAGFDAHFEDDMGQLNLLDSDYYWVTREIMAIAERHARGRVVSALEGGYQLDALGRAAAQHIRALMQLG